MRGLLVLLLGTAGCIDLDVFSAHYDAGVALDLAGADLAGADLSGLDSLAPSCTLGPVHTLPALQHPPLAAAVAPLIASIGHDASGTHFLVGVVDAMGVIEVFTYEAGNQVDLPTQLIGCAGPCQFGRIGRAVYGEASAHIAVYGDHDGGLFTFPFAGGPASVPYTASCGLSSVSGDVIAGGSDYAFNLLCTGGPATLIDEAGASLSTGLTGVFDLRMARSPDQSGFMLVNDAAGTAIYAVAIDSALLNPTRRMQSPTQPTGLGIDAIDSTHALGAGAVSTLHLFVVNDALMVTTDVDTGLSANADVVRPVGVAAGRGGYVVTYFDPVKGSFGLFVDDQGKAGTPFQIGDADSLSVQIAGDPDANGPAQGAFVAAWVEGGSASPTVNLASVICP